VWFTDVTLESDAQNIAQSGVHDCAFSFFLLPILNVRMNSTKERDLKLLSKNIYLLTTITSTSKGGIKQESPQQQKAE
jgi:hypothetical protein